MIKIVHKAKAKVGTAKSKKKQAGVETDLMEALKLRADRLGELQNAKTTTAAKAKKAAADYAKELGSVSKLYSQTNPKADDTGIFNGLRYQMDIGVEGSVRQVVSMLAVFKLLEEIKEGLAFKLMSFNLGDLDRYLTPEQIAEVLETSRTGKRPFKCTPTQ